MPSMFRIRATVCRALQLIALACLLQPAAAQRLPGQGADLSQTSVSGVSSGGYMAVQFHVAHSATVIGAGVLAGGPYYCAEGALWSATNGCTTPGGWSSLPPLSRLVA